MPCIQAICTRLPHLCLRCNPRHALTITSNKQVAFQIDLQEKRGVQQSLLYPLPANHPMMIPPPLLPSSPFPSASSSFPSTSQPAHPRQQRAIPTFPQPSIPISQIHLLLNPQPTSASKSASTTIFGRRPLHLGARTTFTVTASDAGSHTFPLATLTSPMASTLTILSTLALDQTTQNFPAPFKYTLRLRRATSPRPHSRRGRLPGAWL